MTALSLTIVTLVLYLGATWSLASKLFTSETLNMKRILSLATLAIVSHVLLLTSQIFTPEGQNFSLFNVISLVCWIITLSITFVSIRHKAALLQTAVYGFTAIILLISLAVPAHIKMQHYFNDSSLALHITLSLVAYCLLIITTLYAVQSYVISQKLKSKDFSIVNSNLPPLMMVEQQQFQLLSLGTLALTAALASGFIYLDDMFAKSVAHKTVLSLVAWVIFSSLAWGHKYRGWRGKHVVFATIGAAFILTLAYFGSRFVREFILG